MTEENKKESPFIVSIGASAGGLEVLKNFFMHSLPNEKIAYVIITHLSPDHISILPELLRLYTSMKVLPIDNQQKIMANHIYVLPPGKKVTIHQGVLKLIEQSSNIHPKLPIDFFWNSLAKDQGQKVICIILSGMGHDGTLGLRTLRENGGIVIAQIVKTALYEAMPQSAINTGLVDYILLPEDMYNFIAKYIAHFSDDSITLEKSISTELQQVLTFIKNKTEQDFSLYKPNTILRRIQRRMDALQISKLSDYLYYLYQYPEETNTLFKELLIHVTNFFRDPEAFEQLNKSLIEKCLKNKPQNSSLRVWVPACSTGEEVYSIAIMIYESMSRLKLNFDVQIFGTDIDSEAIKKARAGVFPATIKFDITPERLHKFFTIEKNVYTINPAIRRMIIFAVHNTIKDPPFTNLDLLSCRNLFIYLAAPLQKKILSLFHYSLNQNGLLFLGMSESINGAINFFDVIDNKSKIFQRNKNRSSLLSTKYIAFSNPSSVIINKISERIMPEIDQKLSNSIKSILLEYYTPSCVVVDDKGTIVYVHGRTGKFLEFSTGEARLLFFDMIRPELKARLHSAMGNAYKQQKEITLNNLYIKANGYIQHICVRIRPLSQIVSTKNKLLLIVFEEVINKEADNTGKKSQKSTQLEQELTHTRENLQITIEELETSNEELRFSNEELQSTNEELQSTNEERETSKEELQSLNEELSTVNSELEIRIEQLSTTNDDIKNLLDSTDIAAIFLDKNLCIKRFTPKSSEIINLIASDVGRPISHIVSNLKYEKLVDDSRKVLKTLEPITTETIDKNGLWYDVRIIPYRTITNYIDGVVITFIDIHAQKQAEDGLHLNEKNLSLLNEKNNELLHCIALLIMNQNNVKET